VPQEARARGHIATGAVGKVPWERSCLRKPELEDTSQLMPSEGAVGRMPLGGILPISVTTVTGPTLLVRSTSNAPIFTCF